MLATPADLADLGRGFSFTEALVESPDEIRAVEVKQAEQGLEVALSGAAAAPGAVAGSTAQPHGPHRLRRVRRRDDRGCDPRAGAGEGRRRDCARCAGGCACRAAFASQPLSAQTGSLHAAAWVGWDGAHPPGARGCGSPQRAGQGDRRAAGAARGSRRDGLLLVTSRASYEMVQKAATAGVRMLVAVSAPTALAVSAWRRIPALRWWVLLGNHNKSCIRIRKDWHEHPSPGHHGQRHQRVLRQRGRHPPMRPRAWRRTSRASGIRACASRSSRTPPLAAKGSSLPRWLRCVRCRHRHRALPRALDSQRADALTTARLSVRPGG